MNEAVNEELPVQEDVCRRESDSFNLLIRSHVIYNKRVFASIAKLSSALYYYTCDPLYLYFLVGYWDQQIFDAFTCWGVIKG